MQALRDKFSRFTKVSYLPTYKDVLSVMWVFIWRGGERLTRILKKIHVMLVRFFYKSFILKR